MKCPGSVSLSAGVVDEESDFAAQGTFAHGLAAMCLEKDIHCWELIGEPVSLFPDHEVDQETAEAVDYYIDSLNAWHPDRNQGNSFIERAFRCTSLHPLFYGTADFVYFDAETKTLHVWDYKHGAGIVVDAVRNVQTMYYACGALTDLDLWDSVDKVVLHIVQPRGFHHAGPHRHWGISIEDLEAWLDDELIPAMDTAMVSRDTDSGEHCRFCPVRSRACPQLLQDMEEMEKLMTLIDEKGGASELSNEDLDRFYELWQVGKIVGKAAEKTIYSRLDNGVEFASAKLVAGRKNMTWKKGAEAAAKKKFGKRAYKTDMRSPNQMKELPGGDAFAQRWAFKPDGGLTVAPKADGRRAIRTSDKSTGFKKVTKGKSK